LRWRDNQACQPRPKRRPDLAAAAVGAVGIEQAPPSKNKAGPGGRPRCPCPAPQVWSPRERTAPWRAHGDLQRQQRRHRDQAATAASPGPEIRRPGTNRCEAGAAAGILRFACKSGATPELSLEDGDGRRANPLPQDLQALAQAASAQNHQDPGGWTPTSARQLCPARATVGPLGRQGRPEAQAVLDASALGLAALCTVSPAGPAMEQAQSRTGGALTQPCPALPSAFTAALAMFPAGMPAA